MKQLFAWAILLSLTIVMPLYSYGGGGGGITDTQPPSVTHLSPGQGQTFNPYLPITFNFNEILHVQAMVNSTVSLVCGGVVQFGAAGCSDGDHT